MDLRAFSKSKVFELVPKSERKYFQEHGTFKNRTYVKDKLSKYYHRVRFTGRGKNLHVYLGKPKAVGSTELDTALIRLIIAEYDSAWLLSFSGWLKTLGMYCHNVVALDKQIDRVDGVRKSLLITFGDKLHAKQRDYFNRAFTKAAKIMGGQIVKIKMGAIVDDGGKLKEIKRLNDNELDQLNFVLNKLSEKGIRSPLHARKQDEWKWLLDRLGFHNIWTAYAITGVDEIRLCELRAGNKAPSLDKVRTLFKREFRRWLKENIAKSEKEVKDIPDELKELEELNLMTKDQIRHETAYSWYDHCLIEGTAWVEYKLLESYLMGELPYSKIKPPLEYNIHSKTVLSNQDDGQLFT